MVQSCVRVCKIQRSAIPGIGIEVLTPDPVLVLVLGIDLGLLAVLVLVLGIDLSHLAVLLPCNFKIMAKSFVKNFHTCQGQTNYKSQAKIWLLCLCMWLIFARVKHI